MRGIRRPRSDSPGRTASSTSSAPSTRIPPRSLAPELQGSAYAKALQDGVSASFPGAPLVANPLLVSAGVLVDNQTLALMPDDPALGEFRARVQGRAGSDGGAAAPRTPRTPNEGAAAGDLADGAVSPDRQEPGSPGGRPGVSPRPAHGHVPGRPRSPPRPVPLGRRSETSIPRSGSRSRATTTRRSSSSTGSPSTWPVSISRRSSPSGRIPQPRPAQLARAGDRPAIPGRAGPRHLGLGRDRAARHRSPTRRSTPRCAGCPRRCTPSAARGSTRCCGRGGTGWWRGAELLRLPLEGSRDPRHRRRRGGGGEPGRSAPSRGLGPGRGRGPAVLPSGVRRQRDPGDPAQDVGRRRPGGRAGDANPEHPAAGRERGGGRRAGGLDQQRRRRATTTTRAPTSPKAAGRISLNTKHYDEWIGSDTNRYPPREWGSWSRPIPWFEASSDLGLFIGAGLLRTTYGFRREPYASEIRLRAG